MLGHLINQRLYKYFILARLNSPTGYLLLFFPCAYGISLNISSLIEVRYYLLFLLGSVVMRSAGCIINDIFDKDLDKHVERTKNRPLASGALSVKESIFFLLLLLSLGLVILIFLNKLSILLGICAFLLACLYPITKRFTYIPQVFLGITFNFGVLISAAALKNEINLDDIILYLGSIFWTVGYDTIYAFMDLEDDKKVGIKSLALLIYKRQPKYWILGSYAIFFIACIYAGAGYSLVFAVIVALWQIWTLDLYSPHRCFLIFKLNIILGSIVSFALL